MLKQAWYLWKDRREDQRRHRALAAKRFMPTSIAMQISRRCNLQCRMCGFSAWQRNTGYMSVDVFRRTLDEAKLNNVHHLCFSSAQGEPLLSPLCGTFIREALDQGFRLEIDTNCTTLGDRNIYMLVEAAANPNFTIQASFSGYDKASHEAIYAGSKFETTSVKLASLARRLAETNRNKNFWVNGIILDNNKQPHLDYLASIGITERIKIHEPDNFAGIVTYNGKQSLRDTRNRGLRLCQVITYSIVVYDDGTVSACACRDSEGVMKLGHIDDGLRELRTGKRFMDFLDGFMRRDLSQMPLCQKCDIPYGNI